MRTEGNGEELRVHEAIGTIARELRVLIMRTSPLFCDDSANKMCAEVPTRQARYNMGKDHKGSGEQFVAAFPVALEHVKRINC